MIAEQWLQTALPSTFATTMPVAASTEKRSYQAKSLIQTGAPQAWGFNDLPDVSKLLKRNPNSIPHQQEINRSSHE